MVPLHSTVGPGKRLALAWREQSVLGSSTHLSEGRGNAPRGLSERVLGLCALVTPRPLLGEVGGAWPASAGAGGAHQAGAGSMSVPVALMGVSWHGTLGQAGGWGAQLIQTAPLSPLCPASHPAAPSVGRQTQILAPWGRAGWEGAAGAMVGRGWAQNEAAVLSASLSSFRTRSSEYQCWSQRDHYELGGLGPGPDILH